MISEAGRKKPEAGLDQELKDVAALIATLR
jgi:hypothetical protein